MPRQLLLDNRIVADDWQYLSEVEAVGGDASVVSALIVPFDRWLAERATWSAHTQRLGVALLPAHKVELLAADLRYFSLVTAEFPGPSDGRGYTQGRLLRERYKFVGELRASGYVRRDQLFFLARCGFNSFQLTDQELAGASAAFATFSARYQPSNDAGLPLKLQHR